MTLKSLNILYLKLIKKMMAAVVLVLVTVTQVGAGPIAAPLFRNEQQLTASDAATGDGFGHSFAFSGSTVVAGAWVDDIDGNSNQGSVYVFNRKGDGWVETQKLTASDGEADDNFGWSVAISSSTIVVGAWRDDVDGNIDQGSAYVFNLQGGKWVETQKFTASGAANDNFGWLVAVSGSTIFVSATGDDLGHGAVYVFNRQGGSWVATQKLTASDGASGDGFGQSLAISGSTVVAGAPGNDIFQGAIYIFNRHGASWVEEQKLTASDGTPVDFFGFSTAISGSTIVVGSIGEDLGSHFDQGAVYVFNRQGGSWVEEQKLTLGDDVGFGDFFGWSVAVSGSTIVVGVPLETINGNNTPGSAFVFNRQGTDWVFTQKLTPSNGVAEDFFSFSVVVSGSTVVVGSENSNIGKGSVYIFTP